MRILGWWSWLPAICLAAQLPASPGVAAEMCAVSPMLEIREDSPPAFKGADGCAIRLHGARNGAFSGQVVVKAAGAGPEAKVTDLKLKGGQGVIPASGVEVRYALPTGGDKKAFDALAEEPRKDGAIHPVWVTVNVPADAAPGEYEGALTVAGAEVPLSIVVHDWKIPDPKGWTVWADFIQSPESVALQYKVPMWSDEHVRLIGTSYRQLAKVGNKTLYIHPVAHTNFGNEETMIRWTGKNGDARTFTHDFSPLEKVLDACLKNGCRPEVLVVYIWESRVGGSVGMTPEEVQRGCLVTLQDPETGKVSTFEGPSHNNGNAAFPNHPADQIAFWTPVIEGMKKRFDDRGLKDTMVVFGLFQDGAIPGQATVDYLKKIAPYALWADQNHGSQAQIRGVKVGYDTTVWNARFPWSRGVDGKSLHGWNRDRIVAQFPRDIGYAKWQSQIVTSRLIGEMNVAGDQRGFGRMAADFWPVLEGPRGRSSIVARHPNSGWGQLNLRATSYLSPGPKGSLGTVRFEMLREGMQECEARIAIERAILDKKVGADLASKCEKLLDERVKTIVEAHSGEFADRKIPVEGMARYAESDWAGAAGRLYDLAGEVAKMSASGR